MIINWYSNFLLTCLIAKIPFLALRIFRARRSNLRAVPGVSGLADRPGKLSKYSTLVSGKVSSVYQLDEKTYFVILIIKPYSRVCINGLLNKAAVAKKSVTLLAETSLLEIA